MKLNPISYLLVLFLLFGVNQMLRAQKFGYVVSSVLLAEMPEVRAADSNLEALQKSLQKKGEDMVTSFQNDLKELQNQVEAGLLSPKQQEEESQKMQARQEEIQNFEQEVVKQLQDKRGELFMPIYDKINAAIAAVANENGLDFILDQGIVLYGSERLDMTAKVRAKLGI